MAIKCQGDWFRTGHFNRRARDPTVLPFSTRSSQGRGGQSLACRQSAPGGSSSLAQAKVR